MRIYLGKERMIHEVADFFGSGSGAFLTPGSDMIKISGSGYGIRIRDRQPGSYFRELKTQIFGLNYLKSLMRIRNLCEPRSGMEKIRIRDKHPGSATLRGGIVKIIRGRRNRKAMATRKTLDHTDKGSSKGEAAPI